MREESKRLREANSDPSDRERMESIIQLLQAERGCNANPSFNLLAEIGGQRSAFSKWTRPERLPANQAEASSSRQAREAAAILLDLSQGNPPHEKQKEILPLGPDEANHEKAHHQEGSSHQTEAPLTSKEQGYLMRLISKTRYANYKKQYELATNTLQELQNNFSQEKIQQFLNRFPKEKQQVFLSLLQQEGHNQETRLQIEGVSSMPPDLVPGDMSRAATRRGHILKYFNIVLPSREDT